MSSIKLFESKKIRSTWNEAEEKWYFSVQDVVKVLADSADVKQYIKRMLSRDEQLKSNWSTICTPVEMTAVDGKKRKIQASDTKDLLRIIQSIPSPKQGGTVAGNARKELESKTGQKVVSNENYLPEKKKKQIGKKEDNE